MKTEVYSWRVAADLKTGLMREAHRRKTSLSAVLDLAARDWLKKSGAGNESDEEQRRLQKGCIGVLWSLRERRRSTVENAAKTVRARLRRHHER